MPDKFSLVGRVQLEGPVGLDSVVSKIKKGLTRLKSWSRCKYN